MEEPRIITLMASATELVCALGLRDSLVGLSHECDFPESVTELPVCTRPRFDPTGSSAEIAFMIRFVSASELLYFSSTGSPTRIRTVGGSVTFHT